MHNVLDYGAVGDGSSTAADTAGIKAAIAACVDGDVVWIPKTGRYYSFDTSGGQAKAALIDKRITLVVEGVVRATIGAIRPNPPTIFRVIAPGVTVFGAGTLKGAGATNDVNAGSEAELPSLLRVEADFFTMRGLTIDTPYKIGVYLWGCYGAKIIDNEFTGGPKTYGDTAYFAIRANEGGRHVIASNQFHPDARGGMFVNCIFLKGTAWSVVENNVAHWPYEKLCYIAGSYNTVTHNTVIGRAPTDLNDGVIPGTNQAGTIGAVYRIDGQYNKVTNNSSQYGGGVQSIGGKGAEISHNTFLDCGQSAITIHDGDVDLSDITIVGNYTSCGNVAGVVVADGILVRPSSSPPQGPSWSIKILDNIVKGFSAPDPLVTIPVWRAATAYTRHHVVRPVISNGTCYIPQNDGRSGNRQPTWPTAQSATVVDGTITWVCSRPDSDLYAQIRVAGPAIEKEARGCVIAGNQLTNGQRGLLISRLQNSEVFDNRIEASVQGIVEVQVSNNHYGSNAVADPRR